MQSRRVAVASASALALAVSATGCSSEKDYGLGERISIGVKYDQPGLSLRKDDGTFTGFDVDVARYVARELGYDKDAIDFKETKSADREDALTSGAVDFVVATYSITDERRQQVDFAGPYLLAHQDLLVRVHGEIEDVEDLNGKKLCSVSGSTSAQNVKDDFAKDAELETLDSYAACLESLADGDVDAVTTDDAILAGYASQEQYVNKFELAGLQLSNENYGIGVKKGNPELVEGINDALKRMVEDESWFKAVLDHFSWANYDNEPAPEIGAVVN
ncbi:MULTISPECIES: glutamate ABC transporter substrate-binding protein [unclassified Streptomyces]|uniref:glutamate ABC transporter substrate-binding protein n=1 Tax=unclassified Streptomyces TaxID=2593676 RepID=UPI0019078B82|nr:glutamate ABC transporter substrate-binding protein [Streptomyces sp. HSG2]